MAVQPFPYLVLSDGIDTVTFSDGAGQATNWGPVRGQWSPAIAGVRNSALAGRGIWADVEEDLACNVRGSTAALCFQNLDTLTRLLDKAERWWLKTDNIPPVILKYAPQGSTIASNASPLQAIVIGRASTDELNGVKLPSDMNDAGFIFEIDNVQVACLRRGSWIGATEGPSTAAAVANPAVLTVTMPSTANLPSPIEIDFTGFTSSAGTGTVDIPSGFAFVAPNNSFSLQQGESGGTGGLASGATFASTADSTFRASAGNVGRLNHNLAAIGAESVLNWTLPAAFLNSTRIAVYCTIRNNATVSWTVRAEAFRSVTTLAGLNTTPYTTIPAAVVPPTVVSLGTIAAKNGFDTVRLRLATVAGSGTPTIDIDTILVVDLSTNLTYVYSITGLSNTAFGASFASKNVQVAINYNPAVLRDPEARLDILTTSGTIPLAVDGDLSISAGGSVIQAVWYATHNYLGTTYWTTQNNAGAAILNIGASITRRLAYLSPQ